MHKRRPGEPDLVYLKRVIRDSIRDARSDGVTLEEFLRVQLANSPNVNEGGRVVMIGHAVLIWFETDEVTAS